MRCRAGCTWLWGAEGFWWRWGGSRWGGGLVSVRFVLQEDWSVAAPRVPTATHTSVINHTQPRSTKCFVFSSSHTSAASCHHPEKSLLQNNYQEVRGTAGASLKLQGIYMYSHRETYKVATLKQDALLIFLFTVRQLLHASISTEKSYKTRRSYTLMYE